MLVDVMLDVTTEMGGAEGTGNKKTIIISEKFFSKLFGTCQLNNYIDVAFC